MHHDTIELFTQNGQLFAVTQTGHGRRRHALVTPPEHPEDARDALEGHEGTTPDHETQPAGCGED